MDFQTATITKPHEATQEDGPIWYWCNCVHRQLQLKNIRQAHRSRVVPNCGSGGAIMRQVEVLRLPASCAWSQQLNSSLPDFSLPAGASLLFRRKLPRQ